MPASIRRPARKSILHVVSTPLVEEALQESTVSGEVLVWRDYLTTGPTAPTFSLEETTRVRVRYHKEAFWWPFTVEETWDPASLVERDRTLRNCGQRAEVVLWFGPTVIEQFSLMQVLAALSAENLGRTLLSIVTCPRNLMAVYRPEELSAFFRSRRAVRKPEITFAEKGWRHYCAPNPLPLFRLAKRNSQSDPHLCNAILWQLMRYPFIGSGLSVVEFVLLGELKAKGKVGLAIGRTAVDDDAVLMGDFEELYQAAWIFMHAPVPLIEAQKGKAKVGSREEFNKLAVKLTSTGEKVLSGKLDHVATNGIDRWIGGVHLKGKKVQWRWDPSRHVLRRSD